MEVDILVDWETDSQALNEIKKIRNEVIGNDQLKENNMHIIAKLVDYLSRKECLLDLKIECAIVLASFSFGNEIIINQLILSQAHEALIYCLKEVDLKLVEAGLRGLAQIIPSLDKEANFFKDKNLTTNFLSLLNLSRNTQEYVTSILIHLSNFCIYNDILFKETTIQKFLPLLQSNISRIQMKTLEFFIKFSFHEQSAKFLAEAENEGGKLIDILSMLQNKDKKIELQLASAHCIVNMYRMNAIKISSQLVSQRTLDTLVCCCMEDKDFGIRERAAHILADLIERDIPFQRMASISHQIIKIMEDYLLFSGTPELNYVVDNLDIANMKKAAFKVLAAIASNTEDFRKKIKDSEVICNTLIKCLEHEEDSLMLGALRLILPLSRSVYILRTWFREKLIYQYIIEAFMSANDEETLIVTSSLIANMLIDFSPFIQDILEQKESVNEEEEMSEQKSSAILKILRLTRSSNPHIKLNAIWCLMNATFTDDVTFKKDLLGYLKQDDLFHLIRSSDPDNQVINNTLATIRNFLSPLPMVDFVADIHGLTIIESVILILEGDYPINVKEQALCILVNLSAGTKAQKLIMENNDVLRKMISYLMHDSIELQLASNECIFNLVNKENQGYHKRQEILRDMQCFKVLQELHSNCNHLLKERINSTLQQI